MIIIVMGVAGSGKTTVGTQLAEQMNCAFYDGDDFHPPSNVEKMRRGEPLTDQDRWPWLDRLRQLIEDRLRSHQSAVIACSALRKAYRERLVPEDPALARELLLTYLRVSPALAKERILARSGHYMPAALVESQFAALEEPNGALVLDAAEPAETLVRHILAELDRRALAS